VFDVFGSLVQPCAVLDMLIFLQAARNAQALEPGRKNIEFAVQVAYT
jgi:hypothetical protein